jgi:8-oxo-dGTP diphosphatase
VDVVVFTRAGPELCVLLVRRGAEPFAGQFALPGGFKLPHESLEDAAVRELCEETGVLAPRPPAQLRAYGDPGRDPRMNVVTVAFTTVVRSVQPRAGTDAAAAELQPVRGILSGRLALAFDHRRIVTDAVESLRRQLEVSDLATAFIDAPFTLAALRGVYESVWDVQLDPANFRRQLTSGQGWLVATGRQEAPGAKGGKPASLYRTGRAWRAGAPVRRPGGARVS